MESTETWAKRFIQLAQNPPQEKLDQHFDPTHHDRIRVEARVAALEDIIIRLARELDSLKQVRESGG